jgi:hypothetical protein
MAQDTWAADLLALGRFMTGYLTEGARWKDGQG